MFARRFFSCNSMSVSRIFAYPKIGEVIKIKGWVKSLRKQKENVFMDVSDGSTDKKLQVFISSRNIPENLTTGSSVITSGTLNLSPKGQIEVQADKIEVCGKCIVNDGYPFAPRKLYAPEYIRQYLHFRPRTNKFASMLRVRNSANLAIHNYLNSRGFINIHTPILTSNDCEGAGEVFRVTPESSALVKSMAKEGVPPEETYFNSKVFLTVSGQLQLEAAVHGLSNVYTFGPTFRAENSKSRLHLSEFYMLEAEMAFVEELAGILQTTEALIKEVTRNILEKSQEDVDKTQEEDGRNFSWLDSSFPVLTYEEAANVLEKNQDKFKIKFDRKGGLGKEHELFLVQHCGGLPTFVINWPTEMKPFYMKPLNDTPSQVAAFDLLAPVVGEIVGGSLRENNYEALKSRIPQNNSQLDWYLDLRKFGSVPTGGFGLGFERYLQFILGISNIKDVMPFPRWPHNCNL